MITKKKTEVFTTEDGTEHKSIELAQKHELIALIGNQTADCETLAENIMTHRDGIVKILTNKAKKSRKPNGSPKPRRARLPLNIKPADTAEGAA